MKIDNAIHYWAHMLDEALEKPIGDVKPSFYLPKDKHEKFDLNLMFPGDDLQTLPAEDITARIEQVWPDFWDYVIDVVNKEAVIDVEESINTEYEAEKLLFEDPNYIDSLYGQLIDDSKLFKGQKASLEDVAHFIVGRVCDDLESKFNDPTY